MTWADRLRQEVPKHDIPTFLGDMQTLVAALRDGREWHHLLSPAIRRHKELVLAYLDDGTKKDLVASALQVPHSGSEGATYTEHREQGDQ